MTALVTRQATVAGLVQGIGFRPYVARLAEQEGLTGFVRNDGGTVFLTVTGEEAAVCRFLHAVPLCPGAQVTRMDVQNVPLVSFDAFTITPSREGDGVLPWLSPDLGTCEQCEAELLDPKNRRFRHPFISCVQCGPRYSIQRALPYDRARTTMAEFPLCETCQREYEEKGNRRRHAQTIACPHCGPQLLFTGPDGTTQSGEEALSRAVAVLREGGLLAVKNTGGYHLAARPDREKTAVRLRHFKHREAKPFAVMFPRLQSVRRFCYTSKEEETCLLSPARPIVLLKTKRGFAPSVCGLSQKTGAMLPADPVQILVGRAMGPLIMTSLNHSGAPMMIDDGEALSLLKEGLDGVLWHRRDILTPLDDSVVQVPDGKIQMIRRARGYVPQPVEVAGSLPPLLASGGDLKNVLALAKDHRVYLSQHMGDLKEEACRHVREKALKRMQALFSIQPQKEIADRHPEYISARIDRQQGRPQQTVQHHHAHALSVMAEHGLRGPVLGVIFDGTGYGDDGTIWGGEFLLCQEGGFRRVSHLQSVPLPGGDRVALDARLPRWGYRAAAGLPLLGEESSIVSAALQHGIGVYKNSSAGRLFDAVAAELGLADKNRYEGECAVLLQQAAENTGKAVFLPLPLRIDADGPVLDTVFLFRTLCRLREQGAKPEALALGFHQALCRGVLLMARWVREFFGCSTLVLGGGSFQNQLLLNGCTRLLSQEGFLVYRNEQVPPGDGGLALGQAYRGGLS